MDGTDRRLARQAARAQRLENKHERKEARLHARAVNAAVHGRLGKAAVLENRANNQHLRAQAAAQQKQFAGAALASRASGYVNPPAPVVGYTVTQTTYSTAPPAQPQIYYPTGQAPPPPAASYQSGGYPPAPPAQGATYPAAAPTYPNASYPPAGPPPPYPGMKA